MAICRCISATLDVRGNSCGAADSSRTSQSGEWLYAEEELEMSLLLLLSPFLASNTRVGIWGIGWEASESGLYGQDSPLQAAAGLLVLPDGRDSFNACSALTNFSGAPGAHWLALIQRGGGCTFAEKIRLAAARGAAGAVIYNYRGTGNDVLPMSHAGAGSIVAIMIGNLKGTEILRRIESGMKVTMVIEVGKKHGPLMNHYSIFFVSVSFFIVTAATVGYFIFYSARRFRITRAQSRKQRRLKAEAKKAIGQLQLRTLKQGDKETGPDGDSCAVCIELYKPNEVVRILTCNHLFHKNCIDPWLLEHRTCPMCKCDILKALGIEVSRCPFLVANAVW
uniref:Ring finger protein 128 n=1 Tax=Nothoprocta perdicaria TaxID=30464 RepID=A0A8C6YXR5_NOTPE